MPILGKTYRLLIVLIFVLNSILEFLLPLGSQGGTISNKAMDWGHYYFFGSLILLFVWLWAVDNREKYPKIEILITIIITITLIAPWIFFTIKF